MKKTLLVMFYSLMSVMLYGQGFAVSADRMNVAYIGVDNPLTVAAENCDCSKLEVSTANGTIQKTGECEYNFRPETTGKHYITVKVRTATGVKDVGIVAYRIKSVPNPVAMFPSTGAHGGNNTKYGYGVIVKLFEFDFETTFTVRDFTFNVKRNDAIIHSIFNEGAEFGLRIKEVIKTLVSGDTLVITNVRCIGPDRKVRLVNDVTYVLP